MGTIRSGDGGTFGVAIQIHTEPGCIFFRFNSTSSSEKEKEQRRRGWVAGREWVVVAKEIASQEGESASIARPLLASL
jgi:phage protein D